MPILRNSGRWCRSCSARIGFIGALSFLRSVRRHHLLDFFFIKKKKNSNKWYLLTDLRKVNASMKPMDTLQLEIPSPITIPQNWHIITDLQECLFNIPLHSLDREKFTFFLILITPGLIKDFNRLCYLKVCLTILIFVKILHPRLYFLYDSYSLMHISLIIYCNYKREKWYFWHWMAMIFFRLQRKLIKVKSFLK